MKKIRIIAIKEFQYGLRSAAYQTTAALFILITLLVLLAGYRSHQYAVAERTAAIKEQRERWLRQNPKHPHIAAHFGNFAFMPKTPLSFFDHGLDDFTGTVAYLEPHKQNDFSFKPAEETGAATRFGQLTAAMVLQVIFPLLVIFLAFDAFSLEFEQQTIALLYSQDISFRELYAGKFLGLAGLIMILLLSVFASLGWLAAAQNEQAINILLIELLYAGYFLLILSISLLASAYFRNGRSALLLLTGFWILSTVIIPKWASSTGDSLYRLPTKNAFNAAIKHDLMNGINGHDPSDTRAQRIKKALLNQYHVDTIAKLPFNFEGYIMQAGEAYSSKVYDRHFAGLQEILIRQNRLTQWCSIIDPFIAVNNLSMAFAGTDYYSHLNFQRQAEQYRRSFVQQMNHDMEIHSKLGDWDYKADSNTFATVKPFVYRPPSLFNSIKHYLPGLLSLAFWFAVVIALVYRYPVYLNR